VPASSFVKELELRGINVVREVTPLKPDEQR